VTDKYKAMVTDPLVFDDVRTVNHRPHPFMIGPKHVIAASQSGGMLSEAICRSVPCAHRGCRSDYDEHVSDLVMFVNLTRNAYSDEVKAVLKPIADKSEADGDGLNGFAFVETPQKFKILLDDE